MNKNQIGYSLIFVETLKPYNEKTKRFEPLKIKRVEVCQELSEYFSNDEKAKNMMFDKMFDYKEDVKRLLDNNKYDDIPSYHKESLKKDQKIADLEAKLAESESESNARYSAWQEEIGECDRLRVALAEKEKEIEGLKTTNDRLYKKNQKLTNKIVEDNLNYYKKGAIAELEKVKEHFKRDFEIFTYIDATALYKQLDQQIKLLKGDTDGTKKNDN